MKEENIVGEAGGIPGLVRIICDPAGNPLKVEIDDLVFKEEDKGLVSDLFVAAINDMNDKLVKRAYEKIRRERKKYSLGDLLNAPVRKGPLFPFSSHNPPIEGVEDDDGEDE